MKEKFFKTWPKNITLSIISFMKWTSLYTTKKVLKDILTLMTFLKTEIALKTG